MTKRYLQLVFACLIHAFLFVGASWLGQWALILLSLISPLFLYCFVRLCLRLPYRNWWWVLVGQLVMILLVRFFSFSGINGLVLVYGFMMFYWIMGQPDIKRYAPYFVVLVVPLLLIGQEKLADLILISGNPWIKVLSVPLLRLAITGSSILAVYDCLMYFMVAAIWTILFCLGLRWVNQKWN